MRRFADTFRSESAGRRNPAGVPAHDFKHEYLGRCPCHRGDIVASLADRGGDILGDRTEARAAIGMGQIVIDRFRHTDAHNRVAHFLGDLRNLPRRIHGIVAAVVEEIADIVRLENLDQAFVLRTVLLQALQLVAAGTKGAARRMAQASNRFVGFKAGVDEVFGQGADDAVTACEDFPDLVGIAACFLNQAARRGIDDGCNAP